jgi:hypothetical protein
MCWRGTTSTAAIVPGWALARATAGTRYYTANQIFLPHSNAEREQKANIYATLSLVAQAKSCRVLFIDPKSEGTFATDVMAELTFEAAVRALAAFRQESWCQESLEEAAYLEVLVKAPEVRYRIKFADLKTWLDQQGRSPREAAQRQGLKRLLDS